MAIERYNDADNLTANTVVQTVSITAQNTFSDGFVPRKGQFNVSVGGSGWTATVFLQRSFDNGSTWKDVKSWTAPAEEVAEQVEEGIMWRLGVKTGGFGSGTITGRLSA